MSLSGNSFSSTKPASNFWHSLSWWFGFFSLDLLGSYLKWQRHKDRISLKRLFTASENRGSCRSEGSTRRKYLSTNHCSLLSLSPTSMDSCSVFFANGLWFIRHWIQRWSFMWFVISKGWRSIFDTCGLTEQKVITWKPPQKSITSFDVSWDHCPKLMLCLVP